MFALRVLKKGLPGASITEANSGRLGTSDLIAGLLCSQLEPCKMSFDCPKMA